MARVRLDPVYGIVDFLGAKRKGRGRVGGYMPDRAGQWKRVHELNIPHLGLHAVARLIDEKNPGGPLAGYQMAGLVWALLSEAANTPMPGYFVSEQDDVLRPMVDADMALMLRLTPAEWLRCLPLLAPRTGIGFLQAFTTVEIDVGEEEIERYAAGRQLDFDGLRSADSVFLRAGAMETRHCADDGTKRYQRHVTNVTERNATDHPQRGSGPGSPAAAWIAEEDGTAGPPPGPVPSENERHAKVEACRTALRGYAQGGDQSRALFAWVQALSWILKNGATEKRDNREWGKAFSRLWNFDYGGDNARQGRERRAWLDEALQKALEIRADPANKKPAAVFSGWLSKRVFKRKDE